MIPIVVIKRDASRRSAERLPTKLQEPGFRQCRYGQQQALVGLAIRLHTEWSECTISVVASWAPAIQYNKERELVRESVLTRQEVTDG